jgi:hypothetical protein
LKPGVTTDYIDEIVHKACVERDVRYILHANGEISMLTCGTLSLYSRIPRR